MENEPNSVESLLGTAGDYLETKVELLKLQAADKVSGIASSVVSAIILIMVFSLMLFLLSIGIAVWLGDLLGEVYYGFLLVSGFYLLVAVLLYLFRNKWLKKPLLDIFVKKMFN